MRLKKEVWITYEFSQCYDKLG